MSKVLASRWVVGVLTGVTVVLGTSGERTFAQGARERQVTFTKDVAPILQRSCQSCHRPGEMAPMSLLTYEDARPWARAIRQKVVSRQMPPWHVDRTVGIQKFKNDPSLTEDEIATIAAWVDAGAPRGNPADMPPPARFQDPREWSIGKPDLILGMSKGHVIQAAGADWWGDYRSEPAPLSEERYIKAVEIKPAFEARQGVHHAGVRIVYDEAGDMDGGGSLGTYNPGRNGDIYPEDAGVLMKPGARLQFGMHYKGFGKEVVDRTSVGLVLYPKGYVPPNVQESSRLMPSNDDLDIPAGATDVRFDSYHSFDGPIKLVAYGPHMHNRGKRQCLEAIYPDMRTEMLTCANFDFGWQLTYYYADGVAPLLPTGTVLHVTSWFDNSAANRYNPDPKNWVGYGQRTNDEMARNHVRYYRLTEAQYQAELKARRARTSTE